MSDATAATTSAPAQLSWIDTFLGVLLAPRAMFARIREDNRQSFHGFAGAMVLLALVFAMDGFRFTTATSFKWAAINIPVGVVAGGFYWLALAGSLALVGMCFNVAMYRVRAVLINMAWTFLPWVFMAPIGCFRHVLGGAIAVAVCLP